MTTHAALIVGEVVHERMRPAHHRFQYPLFCVRVPLDALDEVAREMAVNRAGLVSFQERDHGARDGSSTLAWAHSLLRQHQVIGSDEVVAIDLHAFPRMFGYVFNPVSFWVCRRASGDVRAVIVEVNNTFGESHRYVLTPHDGVAIRSGELLEVSKQLHVSPFNEVRGGYRFRFHFGDERWLARIDYFDTDAEADGALLHTHISGTLQPLTRASVRRAALRFPLQSLSVVARIHWHALRLLIKRVPFFGKLASHMTGVSRS